MDKMDTVDKVDTQAVRGHLPCRGRSRLQGARAGSGWAGLKRAPGAVALLREACGISAAQAPLVPETVGDAKRAIADGGTQVPTVTLTRISQAAPVLQLRGSQAPEYSHTSSAG